MDCPVCKTPMVVMELQQVEVDYCIQCSGIWLDEGELELLIEDSSEKKHLFDSLIIDSENSENKRRCPICGKKMDKVYVGKDKSVLIDKCRKNHGLWFDAGELHEVVKIGSIDQNNKVIRLLNEMFEYKLKNQ